MGVAVWCGYVCCTVRAAKDHNVWKCTYRSDRSTCCIVILCVWYKRDDFTGWVIRHPPGHMRARLRGCVTPACSTGSFCCQNLWEVCRCYLRLPPVILVWTAGGRRDQPHRVRADGTAPCRTSCPCESPVWLQSKPRMGRNVNNGPIVRPLPPGPVCAHQSHVVYSAPFVHNHKYWKIQSPIGEGSNHGWWRQVRHKG